MANKYTKEQVKEVLNQVVDMLFEGQQEINLTEKAVERLIQKTPVKDLVPNKEPMLSSKKLLLSKAGAIGYEIDIDILKDMSDEFVNLRSYDGHKDPTKDIGIMTQILAYNKDNVTGYGRVTENQVYGLERVGETLGLEPLVYLTDAE